MSKLPKRFYSNFYASLFGVALCLPLMAWLYIINGLWWIMFLPIIIQMPNILQSILIIRKSKLQ